MPLAPKNPDWDSQPAFVNYERILRQTHTLLDAGGADSPEHEALCEACDDKVYAALNDEQQTWLNCLSAYLNGWRDARDGYHKIRDQKKDEEDRLSGQFDAYNLGFDEYKP